MSELSCIATLSHPRDARLGSVGKLLPGVGLQDRRGRRVPGARTIGDEGLPQGAGEIRGGDRRRRVAAHRRHPRWTPTVTCGWSTGVVAEVAQLTLELGHRLDRVLGQAPVPALVDEAGAAAYLVPQHLGLHPQFDAAVRGVALGHCWYRPLSWSGIALCRKVSPKDQLTSGDYRLTRGGLRETSVKPQLLGRCWDEICFASYLLWSARGASRWPDQGFGRQDSKLGAQPSFSDWVRLCK
jgi:hypothetical protein